jgi:anthranilate phosphoribosyltransferase
MHGKTSPVTHTGQDIFKGVPSPFDAMRYHSLVVYEPIPDELEVIASTAEGEIMALKHKQHPTYGVQFHPESILTEHGKLILKNFLDLRPLVADKAGDTMLKPFIAKAINRQDLSADEAEQAMNIIMTGQATPAQIAAYLVAMRMKGETVDEITGSVRAMRANAVRVNVSDQSSPLYDIVGTGGDGAHTFNISTAAAFVVAGTGRKVAKHGNRAASSQCGSADVLGALGVNLDLTAEQVGQAINEVGIGFMFAQKFHPAMKHAGPVRAQLGQRTIFNILGPLSNPAGAHIQLTGVFNPDLTEPLANVLNELGSRAALVIHGNGGTDELTPCGPNRVSHLKDGKVTTYELDPADYGIPRATIEDLRGGTPEESAKMMRDLLGGTLNGARRDAVLLNAAAMLSAETGDFKAAFAEAEQSLASGAALEKLDALVAFSNSFM